MNKTVKKVWNIFTTILVLLTVLFAVFLMGSRLIGFKVYNVLSGSMEPEYSVGDLLYVKKVDPATVKINDPITYVANEQLTVVTHRVVDISSGTDENGVTHLYFHTKGDANSTEDAKPVHANNLIGIPQFSIPLLGYVSDFVQSSPGMYITMGGIVVLIVLVFLPDLISKKEAEDSAAAEEAGE